MLDEILSVNIFASLLIFARVGSAFLILPGFSGQQVNVRARLTIALGLSFILTPFLAEQLPGMPGSPWALALLILGEFFAGALLGTIGLILAAALHVAGTVISFVSTLANSMIYDPISQQQSAIVAGFMTNVGVLLLFVTNMHHVMIEGIVNSYDIFAPGVAPMAGDALQMIARNIANTFKVGVQLAAPFLVVAFAYYMVLGMMTRLSPQIPIFFVAMPIQVVLAISTMTIVLSGIMLVFLDHFRAGFAPFLGG